MLELVPSGKIAALLEEQESILSGRGCQQIVVERYTGKTTDRPKLKELISILQPGDTLIVTKLTDLHELCEKAVS